MNRMPTCTPVECSFVLKSGVHCTFDYPATNVLVAKVTKIAKDWTNEVALFQPPVGRTARCLVQRGRIDGDRTIEGAL
jgi:hypothetical protein